VLKNPEKLVFKNSEQWRKEFEKAVLHIQWDPERFIRGASLPYDCIQVGLSKHIKERYVSEWIISITDFSPIVKKMRTFIKNGDVEKAKRLLPVERVYMVEKTTGKHLLIN
jgi:hypothetical protein